MPLRAEDLNVAVMNGVGRRGKGVEEWTAVVVESYRVEYSPVAYWGLSRVVESNGAAGSGGTIQSGGVGEVPATFWAPIVAMVGAGYGNPNAGGLCRGSRLRRG